tara:strand:- start:95 stop:361 length:267 start_codon:yes stop_codon:yes gene_type:complete
VGLSILILQCKRHKPILKKYIPKRLFNVFRHTKISFETPFAPIKQGWGGRVFPTYTTHFEFALMFQQSLVFYDCPKPKISLAKLLGDL